MQYRFLLLSILCTAVFTMCSPTTQTIQNSSEQHQADWAIIIHGGAGSFWNGNIPEDKKEAFHTSLSKALSIGSEILENGGSSLDAVETTINFLENDSLFNAGKGAVLTSKGTVELDASIMMGKNLNAGAVAGVKTIKNPISAARKVMEQSPHVMLAGSGADQFAKEMGLTIVPNQYFITQKRKKAFELRQQQMNQKMGTVGCVAIDKSGNITAGTSTGGTTYKQWGRIGDSPIIGAGTYASNISCGVSATGTGEYFIRGTVARDIAALMEYKGYTSQQAADEIIHKKLPSIDKQKAIGGVIVVDYLGNISYSFNTTGMLYAYLNSEGIKKFGLYD